MKVFLISFLIVYILSFGNQFAKGGVFDSGRVKIVLKDSLGNPLSNVLMHYEVFSDSKNPGYDTTFLSTDSVIFLNRVPEGTLDIMMNAWGKRGGLIWETVSIVKDSVVTITKNVTFKYPDCPICKESKNIIPHIYGLPSKELNQLAQKEQVSLGGCMPGPVVYNWKCRKDNKWFK